MKITHKPENANTGAPIDLGLPSQESMKPIEISVGGHPKVVLVGVEATHEETLRTIVEAINSDPDCPCCVVMDEAGFFSPVVPVEDLIFKIERMETIDGFRARHGLSEKKGRRRGQRKMDFPRRGRR